jgi:hypothetical protein
MAESWFPPDETTPERALEILEDLRRFVRETGILPEGGRPSCGSASGSASSAGSGRGRFKPGRFPPRR